MTLAAHKELGESADPTELVPGSPAQISANAERLLTRGHTISGLADRIAGYTIPSWVGGVGRSTYDGKRSEIQARYGDYATVLTATGDALTAYAGVLTAAQADAQTAIDKWNEGEAATEAARTSYNADVQTYRDYWTKPASSRPLVAPSHPGVFSDPGEALREEARQILNGARDNVETAAGEAMEVIANLPGARVLTGPGASDGDGGPEHTVTFTDDRLSHEGNAGREGSWDYRNGEWTRRPEGAEEPPSTVVKDKGPDVNMTLHEDEASVSAWNAEGGVQHRDGLHSAEAGGTVEVASAAAGYALSAGSDGLKGEVSAEAMLASAEGSASYHYGHVGVGANGSASVGAEAEASASVGPDGVHASAGAFAGGKAEASGHVDLGGVKPGVTAGVSYGIGAEASADIGMNENGNFAIDANVGATLGLGFNVGFEIEVDPEAVGDTLGDIADGIEGMFR